MPASWGRPMDRAMYPPGWSSGAAVFNLESLDAATASGVITQWVLSTHIKTALVARRYRSVRAFAKKHGLSEDRLHNFLNGNRIARFEDLAAILELLGAGAWPDPTWVNTMVTNARTRSAKATQGIAAVKPTSGAGTKRYLPGAESILDMFTDTTGANGPSGNEDMNLTHPDSRTINARFRRWLMARPEVLAHLELEAGEKPTFDVRAVVCQPGEGGCDIWVGAGMIAGCIWAPADWKKRVAPLVSSGFVFEASGGDAGAAAVNAALIVVSEDGAVEGDVTVVAARAGLSGGEIRWE